VVEVLKDVLLVGDISDEGSSPCRLDDLTITDTPNSMRSKFTSSFEVASVSTCADLSFTAPPTRSWSYVPDLLGLASLAHYVWSDLAAKEQLQILSASFSEACFIFAILQTGCLIVMRKARMAGTLQVAYLNNDEIMDALDGLEGMLIPQFLIDFSTIIGSALISPNDQISPSFPNVEPDDAALRFDHCYSTSFPPLRVLARVIRNQVEGRDWNDFTTSAHDPLMPFDDAILYPGLQFAPAMPTDTAKGILSGMLDSIEYLPAPGACPNLEHYLQLANRSPFHTHMQSLFRCCQMDGIKCAVLTEQALFSWGTSSLQYVAIPSKEPIPKDVRVGCLHSHANRRDIRKAAEFQVLILKDPSQTVFEEETSPQRWPAVFSPEHLFDAKVPPFPAEEFYKRAARRHVAVR
jgi:hypothetical protein